jgi:hypothetical protein
MVELPSWLRSEEMRIQSMEWNRETLIKTPLINQCLSLWRSVESRGIDRRRIYKIVNLECGALMEIWERQSSWSCCHRVGRGWVEGFNWPTNRWLVSVVGSGVEYNTGDEYTVRQYSSWDNKTLAFIQLACSASAYSIAVTSSANVCRARGWKYWDFIGWYPKWLVVMKNSC